MNTRTNLFSDQAADLVADGVMRIRADDPPKAAFGARKLKSWITRSVTSVVGYASAARDRFLFVLFR